MYGPGCVFSSSHSARVSSDWIRGKGAQIAMEAILATDLYRAKGRMEGLAVRSFKIEISTSHGCPKNIEIAKNRWLARSLSLYFPVGNGHILSFFVDDNVDLYELLHSGS